MAEEMATDEILSLVEKRYQAALDKRETWKAKAEEAVRFAEGDQWPAGADTTTKTLLTFNRIGPAVSRIASMLTEAKPMIELTPREDSDDKAVRILNAAYEWSIDTDYTHSKITQCAAHMLSSMGVLKEYFDSERGEWGEVVSEVIDPFEVLLDPNWHSRDPNDLEWLIHSRSMSLAAARGMFPKQADALVADNEYANDIGADETGLGTPNVSSSLVDYNQGDKGLTGESGLVDADRSVTVKEHWYKRRLPNRVVFDKKTSKRVEMDPDEAEAKPEQYDVVERVVVEIWVTTVAGSGTQAVVIDNKKSDFEHNKIPFVFFMGTAKRGTPYPISKAMSLIDLQKLYNKLLSVTLDNAIRTNSAPWLVEESSMNPQQFVELEKTGGQAGGVIKWTAAAAKAFEPHRVPPAPLSDAYMALAGQVYQMIDEETSIKEINRGNPPIETSGKGLLALMRESAKGQFSHEQALFLGLNYWAQLRLSNIQQFMTYEMKLRITDEMGRPAEAEVNKPEMNQTTQTETKINDLSLIKYDVKMQPGSAWERDKRERAELAIALRQNQDIDTQAVLESVEFPNYKQVIERMNQQNMMLQIGKSILENPQLQQLIQTVGQNPQALAQVMQMLGQGQGQQGAPQGVPQGGGTEPGRV